MLIVNSGSYPLTGVTVVVTDVTTFPFRVVPTLFVGTLASHAIRPIGMDLTPIPGSNPRGVASFTVDIYSQNSTSRQLLQFRKGKRMFWDYRSSMSREVPALHSMIPNHPNPKSDIPGFTFTYGWIEDRKAAHK
jgi:hypothetical protein